MRVKNSRLKNERIGRQKFPWRIALVANLKNEFNHDLDDPPDAGAEFDREETLHAISDALRRDGHTVRYCAADKTLPKVLDKYQPHICFNIAEGIRGDGREAQAPALCELLEIPYTGSRIVAQAISLDKAQTKRIWRQFGLPTADFREFITLEGAKEAKLDFPLFVKPSREGTGMGIDSNAIVHSKAELVERVDWVLRTYRQPALVEQFLPGREFTVGFIGNPSDPATRQHPDLYDPSGYHWFPVLEIDTQRSVSPGIYGHDAKDLYIGEDGAPGYLCPADISEDLRLQLIELTRIAAQSLNVCDVSRVDFRLGPDGQPYLMEINTLPGLNPAISDLCIMAASEGMLYDTLITEILYLAADRYNMQHDPTLIVKEIREAVPVS